eukprot:scaffold20376_cov27-Prasinocladus_malaysianus.AAC.1
MALVCPPDRELLNGMRQRHIAIDKKARSFCAPLSATSPSLLSLVVVVLQPATCHHQFLHSQQCFAVLTPQYRSSIPSVQRSACAAHP